MYCESALSSTLEVAIGLAGFSGIIAALRSRGGAWSEAARLNLDILLGASGWAILFSLLPFIALEFLPGHLAWNILSFVDASVFVAISSDRLNALRHGKLSRMTAARIALGMGARTTVLIVNRTIRGAPWPYVMQLARVPVASAQAPLRADIRPHRERCTCPTR